MSKPPQAAESVIPESAPPEYVDLAEVTVSSLEQDAPTRETPAEEFPPVEEYPPDILTVTDESVAPGIVIPPERVELTDEHSGGFKEALAGPSVAGAGSQTADDPFGLNINENPPIPMKITEEGRRFDSQQLMNIAIMIGAILFVIAGLTVGIYLILNRKPAQKLSSPEQTVESAINKVASGNLLDMDKYAVPNSQFVSNADKIFSPYREDGVLGVKKFKTNTNISGKRATVVLETLYMEIISTTKGTEVIDALTITKPFEFPTVINLEKKNNKWIITN